MNAKDEYRRLVELLKTRAMEQGDTVTNLAIANRLGITKNAVDNLVGNRGRVTRNHIFELLAAFPEYFTDQDADMSLVTESEIVYQAQKTPAVNDQGELIKVLKDSLADKQEIIKLSSMLIGDRLGVMEARQKAMIQQMAKVRSKLEGAPYEHFVKETNNIVFELSGVNS